MTSSVTKTLTLNTLPHYSVYRLYIRPTVEYFVTLGRRRVTRTTTEKKNAPKLRLPTTIKIQLLTKVGLTFSPWLVEKKKTPSDARKVAKVLQRCEIYIKNFHSPTIIRPELKITLNELFRPKSSRRKYNVF